MKNKKVTYGLLIAAVIIWGLIAWKIISHVRGDKTEEMSFFQASVNNDSDTTNIHFTLLADYRDPFLSGRKRSRPVTTAPPAEKKVNPARRTANSRTISRKARVRWPSIQYGGVIKNKNSNARTALVKINNKDYLMSEGITIEEIKLLKIYEDSVQLNYKEETKTYTKIH
jgi:hypothetical protein